MSGLTTFQKLAILIAAWLLLGGWGGGGIVAPAKPTAATYVYEKDQHAIPAPVMAALDKLNRQGIVATLFEQDTTDGTGETPEQYKIPLAAAKEAGLPSLAVTAGARVVRVVKDPKTEEAVIEAAK